MRTVAWLVVVVVAWGGACMGALGASVIGVALPLGASAGGPGERQWEMLAIDVAAVSGDVEVGVQDVRGGVQVVRQVKGNAGRVWMSLPLVGRAFLEHNQWPVDVVVRSGGREVERKRVVVELGAGQGTRRGVLSSGLEEPRGVQWGGLGPLVITPLSVEEIVAGPALAFAGCDVVVVTPEVQGRMTEARALELMAAGVQLAAPGDQPPGGGLSGLVWQRASDGEGTPVWVVPTVAVRRPVVVEAGMQAVVEKLGERGLPAGGREVRMAALWVGPVAAVAVVLVWGLFRRRRTVLVVSVVVMAGVAVGFVGAMGEAGGPREVEVAVWREGKTTATLGFRLEERVSVMGTILGGRFEKVAPAGGMMLPVAGTEPGYWALRDVQVVLRDQEHGGGMDVRGMMPGRSRVFLETRRVEKAWSRRELEERLAASSQGMNAGDTGWWLEKGYVYPIGSDAGRGVLLGKWAEGRVGRVGQSMKVWDELRGEVGHRYFLFEADGVMSLIDFGVGERADEKGAVGG